MKKTLLIITLLIVTVAIKAQDVFYHIENKAVYEFIDEMCNEKLIVVNTAVKPYSRKTIAKALKEVNSKRSELNQRQQNELDFYLYQFALEMGNSSNPYSSKAKLNIFNKNSNFSSDIKTFGFAFNDSLFRVKINPIWGVRYISNENGSMTHTWGGLNGFAYIGNNFGIYANLRDNHSNQYMHLPGQFSQYPTGAYKFGVQNKTGLDYSEMRGGVTFGWKWGNIGLIKDNQEWGDNYNGANINSGNYPSISMIQLNLRPRKWVDFRYYHGWLVSEVVDSARSYTTANGDSRKVYRDKYIAGNILSFYFFKNLRLSMGNSIVYSDMNVNPGYLIPLNFFKSVDHSVNKGIDNQNSQMFLGLSSRLIKHTHFYCTYFIDEFSITRVGDKVRNNFTSFKIGGKVENWPIKNVAVTTEYTRTNPITFKHRVPSLTYATNRFGIGHYLMDNSDEIYLDLSVKPMRGLLFKAWYINARHGNDYEYSLTDEIRLDEKPVLKEFCWTSTRIGIKASYQFITNSFIELSYEMRNDQGFDLDGKTAQYYLNKFSPKMYHGKTNSITAQLNFYF
ncbi:MAG: hypothetical protein JXA53_08205 [Bacteroidales bacterium]|nr:hypothetical protein [Bacteroidales bacterium]